MHMQTDSSGTHRVQRTWREAQATYDRLSPWYDLISGRGERRLCRLGLQQVGVERGDQVLEIGIGTGNGVEWIAGAVGDTGQVSGVDLSPHMLERSRARIQKAGLASQVMLACANGLALPFPSQRFQAVFMSFVLELFDTPEIPIVLAECRRVLQRPGRLGVVSLSRVGDRSRIRTIYEWGHERWPGLLDCRPIWPCQALQESGFRIQAAEVRSLWGLPVEIVVGVNIAGNA